MKTTKLRALFLALTLLGLTAQAEETIVPHPLDEAMTNELPYAYSGLLEVRNSIGSASLVGPGVYATAAQVIFNETTLSWESHRQAQFFDRYHTGNTSLPNGIGNLTLGFVRWTSYATRVEEDDSGPGLSSPDTFNLDFALGRLSEAVTDPDLLRFSEVHVDAEGEIGIFRDPRVKMIVGYPTEDDSVPAANQGLMHRTEPGDYFAWWGGLHRFPVTWRDSEDFWVATYDFEGVTSYPGNSGGPMYAMNDLGEWMIAGVLVGQIGSDGVLIRAIDDDAWILIDEAIKARTGANVSRATSIEAAATGPAAVALSWVDTSSSAAGTFVYRWDNRGWERIADLPAGSVAYEDTDVRSGHLYIYEVQPYDADGNRAPRSASTRVMVPGPNTVAADALQQPQLFLRNTGDSNWHLDEQQRLRAGAVRSMADSGLELDVIGPGQVAFTWSSSSEGNDEYELINPTSPNSSSIYDSLLLFVNGELLQDVDRPIPEIAEGEPGRVYLYVDGEETEVEAFEPFFLSGLHEPETIVVDLPEGPHTLQWRYQKDPYTQENEDTGFLSSLAWTPAEENAHPVFGAFAYPDRAWNGSRWFGAYNVEDYPWVAHINLGWLYLRNGDGQNLLAYSGIPDLGEIYTSPSLFPYIYSYSQQGWLYYYQGTGSYGSEAFFVRLQDGEVIRTD